MESELHSHGRSCMSVTESVLRSHGRSCYSVTELVLEMDGPLTEPRYKLKNPIQSRSPDPLLDTLSTCIEYHSANPYNTYTMYNSVDIHWDVLYDIMLSYYLPI